MNTKKEPDSGCLFPFFVASGIIITLTIAYRVLGDVGFFIIFMMIFIIGLIATINK